MAPSLPITNIFQSLFTESIRSKETVTYIEALVASFGYVKRSTLDGYVTTPIFVATINNLNQDVAVAKASFNSRMDALQSRIDKGVIAAWRDRLENDPALIRVCQDHTRVIEQTFVAHKTAMYDLSSSIISDSKKAMIEEKHRILEGIARSDVGSDLVRIVAQEVASPSFYLSVLFLGVVGGAVGGIVMSRVM